MKIPRIITADLETILYEKNGQLNHIPVLIGFCEGEKNKIFSINTINIETESTLIVKNFIEYLCINYDDHLLIYFHNLAKFDGYLLLKIFRLLNYNVDVIVRDNMIYNISLNVYNKKISIKDSYLIIPYSLKKAALMFNKQYFKTDFVLDNINLDYMLNNLDTLKNYLLNDLLTLYELIKNYNAFIKSNFNTEIYYSLTMPSLTQKIFLQQFFKHPFINLSTNQDNYIRDSYLGGIVDIFKPLGVDLVILDFNSMYPAIMQKTKFGLGKAKFLHKIDDLYNFCKNNNAFIKVKVTCSKELKYPLITVKSNDKNIQPTGTFIQTVWCKEILYCLNHYKDYYSFEFISAAYFEDEDFIFKDYIEKLYALRLSYKNSNNEAGEKLIKLMMNSLYGRFGIKVYDNNTKILNGVDVEKLINNDSIDILDLNYLNNTDSVMINYIDNNARYDILLKKFKSRVDWASIITAEARILMQTLKDKVDIYYMDTDSIIIAKNDLYKIKDLLDQDKLGYLKIESEWDYGIFIAPKVYILKKNDQFKITIKGIKQEELKINNEDLLSLFEKKLKLDTSTVSISFKRILNFIRNLTKLSITSNEVNLKLTLDYNKREKIYIKNKWVDTAPLHVNIEEGSGDLYIDKEGERIYV